MINGSIWNKLPLFVLPVAATGILEQLFNASDIAIVGNFVSTDRTVAIAAAGANSPVIGVILNLFIGISLGTNVVIANAIGRQDKKSVEQAVHTSVLAALIGGLLVAMLGEISIQGLLRLLNVPEDVFSYALLCIWIYLIGMPVISAALESHWFLQSIRPSVCAGRELHGYMRCSQSMGHSRHYFLHIPSVYR